MMFNGRPVTPAQAVILREIVRPREAQADQMQQNHPAIGQLTRKGKTVFYAFVKGVYREGPVDHLAALLKNDR